MHENQVQERKKYQQKSFAFILTEDKVVVCTNLGQAFYLAYRTHHWKKRLQVIRVMIELDKINSLQDLASWCAPGIEWRSTNFSYYKELM